MKYFIYFTCKIDGHVGDGNLDIIRDNKISTIDDVRAIESFIVESSDSIESAIVSNWIEFKE